MLVITQIGLTDPTSADSDGDDVGDNADWAPNDPTETDSDGDGVGDNADWAPNDSPNQPILMATV